ncbi:phosphatase PAP2 family protein [Ramlibacter sp.]|uniref:phosphatase PAP2 family protein n=1 Tax=Ramlibacter sp. TaxID=1917967 RepID=UPI0017CB2ED3|nr:phosphatase PAP2 family protein [Ramlibacter sp.]MBA2673811.1 phosphatase PAP2 family protein [Ramlibacter sp.]
MNRLLDPTRYRMALVRWARRSSSPLSRPVAALLDPERPGSGALLLAAMLLVAASWLFLGVLQDVVAGDPLVQADQAVFAFLQQWRTASADRILVAVTGMGSGGVMVPLVACVAGWLAWRRCWRTMGYWLANAVVGETLVQVVKLGLGRHRPRLLYEGIEQFSFPSGHVTVSTVVLGFLAVLLARGQPSPRKAGLAATAAIYVLLVSFSRLYLGAHWLSDAIGGIALGTAWVAFIAMSYEPRASREDYAPAALAGVALAALVVSGTGWLAWQGPGDRQFYALLPAAARIRAG